MVAWFFKKKRKEQPKQMLSVGIPPITIPPKPPLQDMMDMENAMQWMQSKTGVDFSKSIGDIKKMRKKKHV